MLFSLSFQIRSHEIAISELNSLAPSRVSSLFFRLLCCTLLYFELILVLGYYSFLIEIVDFACKLTEILSLFVWSWMLAMWINVCFLFWFPVECLSEKWWTFFSKEYKNSHSIWTKWVLCLLHNLFEISWLYKVFAQKSSSSLWWQLPRAGWKS